MKKIESLYIHYPFCRHMCNYCDFFKKVPRSDDEISAFEALFEKMCNRHKDFMDEHDLHWNKLQTLYIGGGTPSLWGERGAAYLKTVFDKYGIKLSNECEFTLEVNPGSWSEETIAGWEGIGVNRFSIGLQSLDGQYIKVLDRVHSIEDTFKTLEFFQNKKVNYSVDFMLGLPRLEGMPKRDIIKELENILKYGPEHISLYILTTKAGYIHKGSLPNEDDISEEYLRVSEYLSERGFDHYEVSNYGKSGFYSQHNLMYWRSRTVAALGPSATGYIDVLGTRYKWQTTKANFIVEKLSAEEMKLENIYMSLRTSEGLNFDSFSEDQKNILGEITASWESRGLAYCYERKVVLTSKGFLFIDSLLNELFSHKVV